MKLIKAYVDDLESFRPAFEHVRVPRYIAYNHQHNLTCHTHSVTPIIICRFTLDLRQVKFPGSSWLSGNQSASLRFVGSAKGSLQFGLNQDEEEDVVEHLTQAEMFDSPIVDEEGDGGITSGDGRTAERVSVITVRVGYRRAY